MSSLTADHYFWCSGGVPCCFEGVPGYYGMFQGCSGVVPGCSGGVPGMFRGVPGVFRVVPGCSGVFQVLQTPHFGQYKCRSKCIAVLRLRVLKKAYLS